MLTTALILLPVVGALVVAVVPLPRQTTAGLAFLVALMEVGDLFGELGMLDDRPRSALARALEPSRVLAVPYEPVISMFHAQPTMLWNITRLLAQQSHTVHSIIRKPEQKASISELGGKPIVQSIEDSSVEAMAATIRATSANASLRYTRS